MVVRIDVRCMLRGRTRCGQGRLVTRGCVHTPKAKKDTSKTMRLCSYPCLVWVGLDSCPYKIKHKKGRGADPLDR